MDGKRNRKKYIKAAFMVLSFVFSLTFYFRGLEYAGKLAVCQQTAVILMEGDPLHTSEVLRMLEQEKEQEQPRLFTAWQQEQEVTVQNEDLNRSHTVSAVSVCGRSDIVMRGDTWIDEEDREGCMIDEATARALFGSTEVTGMTVEIAGQEKTVRGILYGESDAVLYQADEPQSLENLTVSMRAGEGYEGIRQDFMMRYALSGKFLRMDTLYRAAKILCLLIPLLAGGQLFAAGIGLIWRSDGQQKGRYYGILSVLCMGILLYFLIRNIEIPKDMIPTKWSDFDFWKNWWQNERESLLLLLLTKKQKPQQIYLANFYPVLKYSMLALLVQYLRGRLFYRIYQDGCKAQ